jgi:hypothetical protein
VTCRGIREKTRPEVESGDGRAGFNLAKTRGNMTMGVQKFGFNMLWLN